jgi:hypothetical protein
MPAFKVPTLEARTTKAANTIVFFIAPPLTVYDESDKVFL